MVVQACLNTEGLCRATVTMHLIPGVHLPGSVQPADAVKNSPLFSCNDNRSNPHHNTKAEDLWCRTKRTVVRFETPAGSHCTQRGVVPLPHPPHTPSSPKTSSTDEGSTTSCLGANSSAARATQSRPRQPESHQVGRRHASRVVSDFHPTPSSSSPARRGAD